MPLFSYKALDTEGQVLAGEMEAASAAEVAARLQEQGHLPVEAVPAGQGSGSTNWRTLFKPKPLAGERLVQFTRQLATLLGAGQPLDRALTILLELPEEEASRRIVADMREAVRGGASLSAALERQHGTFAPLYVNMVRAGEAGGALAETLSRLADYLERSAALKARVINALVYPAILLVMVGLALLFLLGYVVPQFAQMYESLDAELPLFTRAVIGLGMFVREWWIVLLVVPFLALLWLDRRSRDPAFRERLDGWLLRRRFFGPLVAKVETGRLARTLGTLVRNGVPLMSALGIARKVMGNRVLAADVEAATEQVRNGVPLSTALGQGGHFPRLALQMIQVGEESGELDAMLTRAAETFEHQTSLALDRMLAALVPIVTVVLAGVVGIVVMAVLTPLYDLTSAIG